MTIESRFKSVEGDNPKMTIWPHLIPIRPLLGYNDEGMPLWGESPQAIYHPLTAQYIVPETHEWEVLSALRNGPLNVTQLASAENDVEKTTATVAELQSHYIIVPENHDLERQMTPDTSSIEMYMSVTEACNFGCVGCATAVDRIKQPKTMDIETGELLLTSMARSADEKGVTNVRVKWAGGEPLMPRPLKLILETQKIIDDLRERYPSLNITQAVLTNGAFLNKETIEQLKTINAHVAVSLWGIGTQNDTERNAKREQDRFSNIAMGLKGLHDSGLSYNVNHVLTPSNAAGFSGFIEALWDTESDRFLGRNWEWPHGRKPIPLGISFFRPQTPDQIAKLNEYGYEKMLQGLRGGFAVMHELIERGIPLPPLDEIDYLKLNTLLPATCGSGLGIYFAAGSDGVGSCHEALFDLPYNLSDLETTNMLDLADREYAGDQHLLLGSNIDFGDIDPTTALALSTHGGSGCPRTSRVEYGELGHAASIAEKLYAPILSELLALEMQRRMAM